MVMLVHALTRSGPRMDRTSVAEIPSVYYTSLTHQSELTAILLRTIGQLTEHSKYRKNDIASIWRPRG